MKDKKEIIITGSSGFLGNNLIKFITKKYKIILIDKKKIKTKGKNNHLKIDIRKYFAKKNLKNVFCIIHLATSESRANVYKKFPNLAKKNIDDLVCILEKIKKQKNKILFIFTSSRDVEKNNNDKNKNLYSFSKEYSENLIIQYALNSNFIFKILRIPDLFDYNIKNNPKSKAVYKIVKNLERSNNILVDNPEHYFEFIETKEISKVINNILKSRENKSSILSFRGEKINILKLIRKLTKLKSSKSKIVIKKKIIKMEYLNKVIKSNNKNFFKKLRIK